MTVAANRPTNVAPSASLVPEIDLVVTACEGREHLLGPTLDSFAARCPFIFARRILALDGRVSPEAIERAAPDVVVQNWRRRGYVASIQNLLGQVQSDTFFWLEDDWAFESAVDLSALHEVLARHPDWVQIRLSKVAPLAQLERTRPLGEGMFESAYGFSANPSLNRSAHLRRAFAALAVAPHEGRVSFEEFLSDWFAMERLTCVVKDPGEHAPIAHSGFLESTPRQFHMLSALHERPTQYVSGMPIDAPLWRRAAMFIRLFARFGALATRQFASDAAYELAFRVVHVPIPHDHRGPHASADAK